MWDWANVKLGSLRDNAFPITIIVMPDPAIVPVKNFDGTQTIADALLAQKLISQEQYDDIKVKSASEGVSEESIVESLKLVPSDKIGRD